MSDFTPHAPNLFNDENHNRHDSRLGERFLLPPFTVLNARDGWWQNRKAAWLALGIKSEIGRGQERLEMAHPATTATIDFYVLKRALESDKGRELTTAEARTILAARGEIVDDRADNASRKASAIPGGARGLILFGSSGDVDE